jgi:Cellulase (glycosyl hydrolase family 5)
MDVRLFHTKIRSGRLRAVWAGAWLATLTLLAGLVSLAAPAQPAAAYGTGCATAVVKPVGPFHIAGDNRTVVDANGRTFISYGTTVPGLSNPNLTTYPSTDKPKIDATANYWCGNTVRLQVSQYAVTHNTTPDDSGTCQNTYLKNALDPEVQEAEADGLVVVINDQTESDSAAVPGLANEERDPTKATFAFWNCVTAHQESWRTVSKTYAQDPQVIFDIFNEPRVDACNSDNGPNGPYEMNVWRNGTQGNTPTGLSDGICGPAENYQGMDAVAYHIRVDDNATKTLLWVEGPGAAGTLAGLAQPDCGSTPTGNCFITPSLGPIVYSVHHPYGSDITNSNSPPANTATWWDEFGWVIDHPDTTSGWAPVVAGEWTNFDAYNASGTSPGKTCWSDAPTSIPNFLSYLNTLGVGLNAYQLAAPPTGYLLKANGNWTDTTNYTDAPWQSKYCTDTTAPLLGAGSLIRKWFQQQD